MPYLRLIVQQGILGSFYSHYSLLPLKSSPLWFASLDERYNLRNNISFDSLDGIKTIYTKKINKYLGMTRVLPPCIPITSVPNNIDDKSHNDTTTATTITTANNHSRTQVFQMEINPKQHQKRMEFSSLTTSSMLFQ